MNDLLELEVEHFGPIVEAKLDLRPLTVFIGPSNTGKSYLAILIYALHRFFSGDMELDSRSWYYRRGRDDEEKQLSEEAIDALREIAQSLLDNRELPEERSLVLPAPVMDLIRAELDVRGRSLRQEISRCFGTDINAKTLIRKGHRAGADIVLRQHISDGSAPIEHRLTLKAQASQFRTTIPEGIPIPINEDDHNFYRLERLSQRVADRVEEKSEAYGYGYQRLIESLAELAIPLVAGPLHSPAFYLPADRTGVMHAHSAVVSAMIGSAPLTALRPAAHTPMLSGVLADFLQQLIALDHPRYQRSSSQRDFAAQIEKDILGGSVNFNRSELIDYPQFTYQPEGWKDNLPLMNTSAMVSELAPVVLYLRHIIEPDNLLIIEEPEAHLHPAMQAAFARQLASIVQAGIRVIVTTHSEWVLDQLANLVRLSALDKKQREGLDMGEAISSDQFGAWLFRPKQRPKGTVVEEIRVDPDAGGLMTDYSEVAEELYNTWAEIGNRAMAGKGGDKS